MRLPRFLQKPKRPRLLLRRVMGDSMLPTLRPGNIIVGIWPRYIRPGDVVIVRHEGLDKVKRVKDLVGDRVYLVGDNATNSTDSRDFGWLESRYILAKVLSF